MYASKANTATCEIFMAYFIQSMAVLSFIQVDITSITNSLSQNSRCLYYSELSPTRHFQMHVHLAGKLTADSNMPIRP